MAGSRHLFEAVAALWYADTPGLDDAFRAKRASGVPASEAALPTLSEGEARPKTPFPYCVFVQDPTVLLARSSGRRTDSASKGRHYREIPVTFRIHGQANAVGGSGKKIAADLGDLLMQQFGGADTAPAATLALDTEQDSLILTRYETDYFQRESEDEWAFVLRYVFLVDMRVAVY